MTYPDIPGDDVAAFIATAVFAPTLNRITVEITGGGTLIQMAIAAVASKILSMPIELFGLRRARQI